MVNKNIVWMLGLLVLVGSSSAYSTNQWSNGLQCNNLTGMSPQSLYLNVSGNPVFDNITINMTGYFKEYISEYSYHGWNVTTYSGLWLNHSTDGGGQGGDLLNPQNTNDGSLLTSSQLRHGIGGTYYASHYIINYSLNPNATTQLGVRARFMGMSDELYPMCKDKTTGKWELLIAAPGKIVFTDTLPHNYSIDILSNCLEAGNETIELDFWAYATDDVRIAEIWVYKNESSYPENLTLLLNNFEQVYNNDSVFNGSDVEEIGLDYVNEYFSSGDNLSFDFYMNDTGILEVCLMNGEYHYESNLTIHCEETREPILSPCSVSIASQTNLSEHHYNKSSNTGNLTFQELVTDVYQFLFDCDNMGLYSQRSWWLDVGDEKLDLDFYLYNDTSGNASSVLVTIYNENLEPLEDYYVAVYRVIPSEGVLIPLEMDKTNFNGEVLFRLIPLEPYYVFNVYKDDFSLLYQSGWNQILQNSLSIQLNEQEDFIGSWDDHFGIRYASAYDNVSRMFSFTWADNNQILDNLSLKVDFIGSYGVNGICNNVSESFSGTLYCTLPNMSRGSFVYDVYIHTLSNNSPQYLDGNSIDVGWNNELGGLGIFLSAILTGTLMSIGVSSSIGKGNPAYVIIYGLVGLGFCIAIGFLSVSLSIFIGIVLSGGLILYGCRT